MQRLEEMERDILEVVYDHGWLGYLNSAHTPAARILNAKYPAKQEQQALVVAFQYLLEERYLFPFFDGKTGKELRDYARGITPKGTDRLRRLRHPRLSWICDNWFPLLVAATSAVIGTTNIVVNL